MGITGRTLSRSGHPSRLFAPLLLPNPEHQPVNHRNCDDRLGRDLFYKMTDVFDHRADIGVFFCAEQKINEGNKGDYRREVIISVSLPN